MTLCIFIYNDRLSASSGQGGQARDPSATLHIPSGALRVGEELQQNFCIVSKFANSPFQFAALTVYENGTIGGGGQRRIAAPFAAGDLRGGEVSWAESESRELVVRWAKAFQYYAYCCLWRHLNSHNF